MTIDIVIDCPDWDAEELAALAAAAEAAAFARLGLDPAAFETALLACDDARIAALNAEFRGKAQPTNVLSWPSQERRAAAPGHPPALPEAGEIGDIALAHGTCAREAAAAGKPFADHVSHLIVHGLLHLLGYDHETRQDAALMEGLEREILASLGIADPY